MDCMLPLAVALIPFSMAAVAIERWATPSAWRSCRAEGGHGPRAIQSGVRYYEPRVVADPGLFTFTDVPAIRLGEGVAGTGARRVRHGEQRQDNARARRCPISWAVTVAEPRLFTVAERQTSVKRLALTLSRRRDNSARSGCHSGLIPPVVRGEYVGAHTSVLTFRAGPLDLSSPGAFNLLAGYQFGRRRRPNIRHVGARHFEIRLVIVRCRGSAAAYYGTSAGLPPSPGAHHSCSTTWNRLPDRRAAFTK